ncbi:MAG TPA: permease [Candidatus Limnocylindria bacterium]|nr:permease [Candidatus Limnocylindria bacterium]
MNVVEAVLRALAISFAMTWEILWALILGFTLSAIVQAVVSKAQMSRLLPDDSPRTLALATLLGAASSSCSYAAVALARSLFQTGASFTAAMTFEIASTNLVIELGIILVILMGWQFAAAEFVGGAIMIALLALIFRHFLTQQRVAEGRAQAEKGLRGYMEGHAEMDMSVSEGTLWQKIFSAKGFTAISHVFVMDWASVIRDIALGLLIAGALAAWVPASFWKTFFLSDHPQLALIWGPLVGPIVSVVSFVCSIGNVPLAAVLWNNGISFGGVISFIFADLIILPILSIKRRYYGTRMTIFLFGAFYAAMALAGLIVELLFGALGLIPQERNALVAEPSLSLNYTTVLNALFLALAAVLLARAWRTGGFAMLAMMDPKADETPSATHHH